MAKKNFVITTVATAPDPAGSGDSLVVASGMGQLFADEENAIVFPAGEQPDSTNAEILFIADISTDTLTFTRGVEGTGPRDILVGDIIMQGITAGDWNDLKDSVPADVSDLTDSEGIYVPSSSLTGTGTYVATTSDDGTHGEYLIKFGADGDLVATEIHSGDVVEVSAILDEDDMDSDSDAHVPTQQSVKAYVDAKLFVWRGEWETDVLYAVNDTVQKDGSGYVCVTGHTSDAWSTDLTAGKWELFVQGAGSSATQIDCSGGTSDTYGVLSGSVNSSNTRYTVSLSAYTSGKLKVWLNGQLQTQGSSEDWVETTPASGTFDFNTAPATGDIITVEYV